MRVWEEPEALGDKGGNLVPMQKNDPIKEIDTIIGRALLEGSPEMHRKTTSERLRILA